MDILYTIHGYYRYTVYYARACPYLYKAANAPRRQWRIIVYAFIIYAKADRENKFKNYLLRIAVHAAKTRYQGNKNPANR